MTTILCWFPEPKENPSKYLKGVSLAQTLAKRYPIFKNEMKTLNSSTDRAFKSPPLEAAAPFCWHEGDTQQQVECNLPVEEERHRRPLQRHGDGDSLKTVTYMWGPAQCWHQSPELLRLQVTKHLTRCFLTGPSPCRPLRTLSVSSTTLQHKLSV